MTKSKGLKHGGTIVLFGDIEDYADFAVNLINLENSTESDEFILIELNSPGGDHIQALAIADRILTSKRKIVVSVFGECSSAAMLILESASYRKISASSYLMIHEPSITLNNANISRVEEMCKNGRKLEREYLELLESRSNKSYKFYKNLVKDRQEHRIDAKTALEYGLVDEVI